MKMSKLEKIFVNSTAQATKSIKHANLLISQIDLSNVEKILEVGCGIGMVASYLAKKYKWNVTGTDLDPDQIERAKMNYRNNRTLHFYEADVIELPFENGEFDMVLSFDVLHHVPNWHKAINEISRVLKPGGFYIFHDLVLSRVLARMLQKSKGLFRKSMNFFLMGAKFFTLDEIINHLKRNNFEIIHKAKPQINIFLGYFGIISQRSPNIGSNYIQ